MAEYGISFNTLISVSFNIGFIEKPKNDFHKQVLICEYDLLFTQWLQKNKRLKYGDAKKYEKLCTLSNWKSFILENEDLKFKQRQMFLEHEFDDLAESWKRLLPIKL